MGCCNRKPERIKNDIERGPQQPRSNDHQAGKPRKRPNKTPSPQAPRYTAHKDSDSFSQKLNNGEHKNPVSSSIRRPITSQPKKTNGNANGHRGNIPSRRINNSDEYYRQKQWNNTNVHRQSEAPGNHTISQRTSEKRENENKHPRPQQNINDDKKGYSQKPGSECVNYLPSSTPSHTEMQLEPKMLINYDELNRIRQKEIKDLLETFKGKPGNNSVGQCYPQEKSHGIHQHQTAQTLKDGSLRHLKSREHDKGEHLQTPFNENIGYPGRLVNSNVRHSQPGSNSSTDIDLHDELRKMRKDKEERRSLFYNQPQERPLKNDNGKNSTPRGLFSNAPDFNQKPEETLNVDRDDGSLQEKINENIRALSQKPDYNVDIDQLIVWRNLQGYPTTKHQTSLSRHSQIQTYDVGEYRPQNSRGNNDNYQATEYGISQKEINTDAELYGTQQMRIKNTEEHRLRQKQTNYDPHQEQKLKHNKDDRSISERLVTVNASEQQLQNMETNRLGIHFPQPKPDNNNIYKDESEELTSGYNNLKPEAGSKRNYLRQPPRNWTETNMEYDAAWKEINDTIKHTLEDVYNNGDHSMLEASSNYDVPQGTQQVLTRIKDDCNLPKKQIEEYKSEYNKDDYPVSNVDISDHKPMQQMSIITDSEKQETTTHSQEKDEYNNDSYPESEPSDNGSIPQEIQPVLMRDNGKHDLMEEQINHNKDDHSVSGAYRNDQRLMLQDAITLDSSNDGIPQVLTRNNGERDPTEEQINHNSHQEYKPEHMEDDHPASEVRTSDPHLMQQDPITPDRGEQKTRNHFQEKNVDNYSNVTYPQSDPRGDGSELLLMPPESTNSDSASSNDGISQGTEQTLMMDNDARDLTENISHNSHQEYKFEHNKDDHPVSGVHRKDPQLMLLDAIASEREKQKILNHSQDNYDDYNDVKYPISGPKGNDSELLQKSPASTNLSIPDDTTVGLRRTEEPSNVVQSLTPEIPINVSDFSGPQQQVDNSAYFPQDISKSNNDPHPLDKPANDDERRHLQITWNDINDPQMKKRKSIEDLLDFPQKRGPTNEEYISSNMEDNVTYEYPSLEYSSDTSEDESSKSVVVKVINNTSGQSQLRETLVNNYNSFKEHEGNRTPYEKSNMKKIYNILEKCNQFDDQIESFEGIFNDQQFYCLDENLQRNIERLDRIDPNDSEELTELRRNVIRYIYVILEKLERKANIE